MLGCSQSPRDVTTANFLKRKLVKNVVELQKSDQELRVSYKPTAFRRWVVDCNSCNGETANGIETWYYKTGSKQSKMFAQEVQSCLISETKGFLVKEKDGTSHAPKDRGVRSDTLYYTLRHTTMPSLVIECGFMSHDGEVQLMMTQEYQNALARGIARGILNTFAL